MHGVARSGKLALRALATLLGLAWVLGPAVRAEPANHHVQLDVGIGSEAQSSPVFQISPEGNILYLDGAQGLRGTHVRTSLQASADWTWEGGLSTSMAAEATLKRAPATPDLDFAALSLQPAVHMPWGTSNVGAGLNILSYDVGGHHFRDAVGVQLDWTHADSHGLWGVVAEASSYRHAAAFADMDAVATSVVLLRQVTDPLPGVDGLDVSCILGREVNDHGYLDLSSRSAMLHATVRWTWLGAEWSLGRGWRVAVFEDSLFANEPVRSDQTVMTDLAAQWPLSERHALRVEYNQTRNGSSTRLYDNHYEQLSITFRSSW